MKKSTISFLIQRTAILGLTLVASLFIVGCGEQEGTGAAPSTDASASDGSNTTGTNAGGSDTTDTGAAGGSDSK